MNLSVVVFCCLAVLVSTDDGWRSRYVRRGPAWRTGGNIMQTPFGSPIRRQFGAIGPKVFSGRTSARGAMILRKRLQDRVRSFISKERGPMKSFYGMSTPQRSPPRFPVQLPNLVKPNVDRIKPVPIWQRVLKMIFEKGDDTDGPGSFGRRGVSDRDIPRPFGRLGDVDRDRPGLFGRIGDSDRDRPGPFGRRGDNDRDRPGPFGRRGDGDSDRPGPFGQRVDGGKDTSGPFGRRGYGNIMQTPFGSPIRRQFGAIGPKVFSGRTSARGAMILRKRLQDRIRSLISKNRGPMKPFYGMSTPQRSPPRFPVQLPNLIRPNVDRSKPEPIWQRVLKMIFAEDDDNDGPGSFGRRGVDDKDKPGPYGRLGDVHRDRPGIFGRRGDGDRDRPGLFGQRGDGDKDTSGQFGRRGYGERERPGPFGRRGDSDIDRPGPFRRRGYGDRDRPGPFGRRDDSNRDRPGPFGRRGDGDKVTTGPYGRRDDGDSEGPGLFERRGDGDRDRPRPFGRRDDADRDKPEPFGLRGDGDRDGPGSYGRRGDDGDRPRPYGGHSAVDNSGVPEFYRRRWGSGYGSNRLIDRKIGNPVQKLMTEIAKIFTGQGKEEDAKPDYQPNYGRNRDRKESYDKKESSNHFKNVMVKVIKMMQKVLGKDMPVNVNDDKICKKKCQAKSKCFGKQDFVKMMMVAPKPCKSCVMKACDSKMDRQCFLDAHMTCDDVCPKISSDKVKDKAESCKVCMDRCEAEGNNEYEENLKVNVTNDDEDDNVEEGSIVDDGDNDGTWPEMEDDDVEDDGGMDLDDDISPTGDMM